MTIVNQTGSIRGEIVDIANSSKISIADFAGLDIFAPLGRGYRRDQLQLNRRQPCYNSHYYDPIYHPPGELSGNSRIGGDATHEVQLQAMLRIIHYGLEENMNDHEIALTLAIARAESGFNPDAASNESATGLGQFVYDTGTAYGISDANRWNMDVQAKALVQLTRDNLAEARRRGYSGRDLERYTYKFHHDGTTRESGGLALADSMVLPYVPVYTEFLQKLRSLSHVS